MGISEKAIIGKEGILELIPQRPPFVFVDSYYGEEGGVHHTGFTPVDSTLFAEEGKLLEQGIIEHMAQSAAASTGYSFRSKGEEVPVGFIGAVAGFELLRLPVTGMEIRTTIRFAGEFGGISLVEAQSSQSGELIAGTQLKIFLNTQQ